MKISCFFLTATLFALNVFSSHFSDQTVVYHINLPEAHHIKLSFSVTTLVDVCNSHMMGGDINKTSTATDPRPHYNAIFYIIGTEMACHDPSVKQETFAMTHYVKDSEFTIEVPDNVNMVVEAVTPPTQNF